jgi:hypothetical protein
VDRAQGRGETDVGSSLSGRPIVLTGGIGSGKSSVGRLLAGWGAFLVDADQLARDVVASGTRGRAALEALLGPEVVAPDGSLDRGAMAERVFADTALTRPPRGLSWSMRCHSLGVARSRVIRSSSWSTPLTR